MLNGRNHPQSRNGLVVNGRGLQRQSEADTSALYGEYEQRLASELADLLRSSPSARSDAPRPHAPVRAGLDRAAGGAYGMQAPSPRPSPFVAAARPQNDFVVDDQDEDPPLPLSWRHEPRQPQPSWMARQLRAGLLGLGAGLIVVLPAIAVFSGRLDPWLSTVRPSGEPSMLVAERNTAAPRIIMPPSPARSLESTAAAEPAPVAAEPVVERAAVQVKPVSVATVEVVAPRFGVRTTPVEAPPEPAPAPQAMAAMATPPGISVLAPPAPPVDETQSLLELGQKLVKDGDITGARTPLAKAANLGNPEAMLALGETFDPILLAAWGARDVKADASTARLFYGRAITAGLPRARARLDALN